GRERGDGAAGRLREAEPGDGLGAQGELGEGRPRDDPVVRGEPRPLDRPRRLAPAGAGSAAGKAVDARPKVGGAFGATWSREGMSRVLVTGGGGFLGSHLVELLADRGDDVFVARRADYDLTHEADAERLFAEAQPELVFHLAAEVGGIGANRANPGRYWYANLVMGANVLEQARVHEIRKTVLLGTICAYPKFTPVPFQEDELWNGYPEETNAPYGVAKKALLVGAQA